MFFFLFLVLFGLFSCNCFFLLPVLCARRFVHCAVCWALLYAFKLKSRLMCVPVPYIYICGICIYPCLYMNYLQSIYLVQAQRRKSNTAKKKTSNATTTKLWERRVSETKPTVGEIGMGFWQKKFYMWKFGQFEPAELIFSVCISHQ